MWALIASVSGICIFFYFYHTSHELHVKPCEFSYYIMQELLLSNFSFNIKVWIAPRTYFKSLRLSDVGLAVPNDFKNSLFEISQYGATYIPRLHYVPGGHDGHVSGHRGRNGVTVRHRRGTVSTNVSRRDCRGRRGKFLNSQKICHGNHGADDLLFRT